MGIWITTNLSVIWRDRTGALLPAIQFLRFFLRRVGPDSELVWFNRPLVVMSPADLYQLKIWPKTHLTNKSVQQVGFFFWTCWKNSLKTICENWLAFGMSLLNSEHRVLFVSLLLWNSQKGEWAKSVRKTELLTCRSSWCFSFVLGIC